MCGVFVKYSKDFERQRDYEALNILHFISCSIKSCPGESRQSYKLLNSIEIVEMSIKMKMKPVFYL